jgi:hypothetical protein
MTVDTSQNVGIGTTSPIGKLDVTQSTNFSLYANHTSTGGYSGVDFLENSASKAYIVHFGTTASGSERLQLWTESSSPMVFGTSDSERMRINSSGILLVGTTTSLEGTAASFAVSNASGACLAARNTLSTSGLYWTFGPDSGNSFRVFNQTPLGVYIPSGNTAWSAFSDERLKTDLLPITDATRKVATLRALTGRFKTDDEGTRRAFLIAQDVQAVLPEAVHVGEDEDKTLGLAYTEVIPLLVAAIKELSTKNDALTAQVIELSAKVAVLEQKGI